jgi:hypothetical protein
VGYDDNRSSISVEWTGSERSVKFRAEGIAPVLCIIVALVMIGYSIYVQALAP